MSDDNRSRAASSLRFFFDEQVDHLQALWGNLGGHIGDEVSLTEQDRRIVEDFVDSSNSKMRAVDHYADKLRDHVRLLYQHVLQVAEEIPPPVDVNGERFGAMSLVSALFVNSRQIDALFHAEPEVKAYLLVHAEAEVPVVYALLNASKSEKSVLGVGMLGGVLARDIPMQAVNFSAHKIRMPCASSEALDAALKHYLFEHTVALVKQEMAARKAEQAFGLARMPYQWHVNSLGNPDVYLSSLLEYIESPDKLLSIVKTHYRLDRLGIKLDNGERQGVNEFDIHELIWSDNTRNVVLQVAYKR